MKSTFVYLLVTKTGETLLEVLIAITILIIFWSFFYSSLTRDKYAEGARHIITGCSILEQEIRIINAHPESMLYLKKKIINGNEWIISAEKKGSGMVQYHLIASFRNKNYSEIYYLHRETN